MITIKDIDPVSVNALARKVGFPTDQELTSGFYVQGLSFGKLCKRLAAMPAVRFVDRRRFFWWSDSIRATFTFKNHPFTITPDAWDDTLWVQSTGVEPAPPTQELQVFLLRNQKGIGRPEQGAAR